MQMNVAEAKLKLSELLAVVDAGEDVGLSAVECQPRAWSQ